MDPVTAAIVAALAAGVIKSAGAVGEKVLVDAYTGLKGLIRSKFGDQSQVAKAVADLESDPESKGRTITLEEQVGKVRAADDPEIRKAAEALLEQVKQQPGGGQIVQQVINSTAVAQAVTGSATVTYSGAPTGQPGQPGQPKP